MGKTITVNISDVAVIAEAQYVLGLSSYYMKRAREEAGNGMGNINERIGIVPLPEGKYRVELEFDDFGELIEVHLIRQHPRIIKGGE